MSVLKPKGKDPLKLIGAFVPLWIQQYLLVYTTAKGITKTSIIKKLIEDWVQQQKVVDPYESLLQEIIHKVQLQWKLEKSINPSYDLFIYKRSLRQELTSKGFENVYIETIINELN
jgi:hypothetical protein